MTFIFDGWHWKTIGHLFYATLRFVHHFKAIGEFKLELQTGNSQFGSKYVIFCPVWPWNSTDDLAKKWAPVVCRFKLCASFHSHRWIRTKVTVRKRSIRVEIGDFFSRVTLKFYGWHWKTIGHLFFATSSFVHHFVAIGDSNWSYSLETPNFGSKSTMFLPCDLEIWRMPLKKQTKKQGTYLKQHQALCIISSSYVYSIWSYSPQTAKLGYDLCDLDLWHMTLTFCIDIAFVFGNNSWRIRNDTMIKT